MSTLNRKKADFTKNLLLDAAETLSETLDISDLSFKTVAEHAEISQRTMFRHYHTRKEFLDALTVRLYNKLDLPEVPNSVEELPGYIELLYHRLDQQPRTVMVLLSADLLPGVINTSAKARLESLTQLLAATYTVCARSDVIKTAANIRYVMSASSWRYYRVYFEFDLKTSIECVSMMVRQSLECLEKKNARY